MISSESNLYKSKSGASQLQIQKKNQNKQKVNNKSGETVKKNLRKFLQKQTGKKVSSEAEGEQQVKHKGASREQKKSQRTSKKGIIFSPSSKEKTESLETPQSSGKRLSIKDLVLRKSEIKERAKSNPGVSQAMTREQGGLAKLITRNLTIDIRISI